MYADVVATTNKLEELPSGLYANELRRGLSRMTTYQMMKAKSLTNDTKLDTVLLKYHKMDWVK